MDSQLQDISGDVGSNVDCTPVYRTFLCSDVVGFTRMTEQLGDLEALRVMNQANRAIRALVQAYDGEEWELRGDGFLFSFSNPANALRAADEIRVHLAQAGMDEGAEAVEVRMAIHEGPVYISEGRMFGRNLILAYRLLDYADAGEIVVSGDVRQHLINAPATHFSRAFKARPKGFTGKVDYFRVTSSIEESGRWIPIRSVTQHAVQALSLVRRVSKRITQPVQMLRFRPLKT